MAVIEDESEKMHDYEYFMMKSCQLKAQNCKFRDYKDTTYLMLVLFSILVFI